MLFDLLPDDLRLRTGNPAWSADGTRLAAYRDDGSISVWDASTGESLRSISGPGGVASWLSWFPSGDRLLTAGADDDLKVWDVESGSEVLGLTLFGSDAGLSPDGQRFLANIESGGPLIAFDIWETLDELVALAKECCVIRELTQEERVAFGLDESALSTDN
jgi:WD40 repeat protein